MLGFKIQFPESTIIIFLQYEIDALIVSNVPKRSVVRRKKEEVKSPCPLLLCPILDYVVKGNYMVLLGIARY
jgi:hypothetical protein